MYTVSLKKFIENMGLENLTPEIDLKGRKITEPEVNRPALQLVGFYDYFNSERVQIIGHVEQAYMDKMEDKGLDVLTKLMSFKIPCIVLCRGIRPTEEVRKVALEKGVPILLSEKSTSDFEGEAIRWLKVELAPRISIHGVLVDVYGEGILIIGESGIGKSEAALELIKRGHRLVADDVVEIKKVSEATLIGSAPPITRHLIELRGIGIIDVKTLFGISSVKNTQQIDLVIRLEDWVKDKEYDRMGLEDKYTEFLGNKVVCQDLPIRPGRNLAIIVESAAVNHRQKKMGYNAAKEFSRRVTENIMKGRNIEEEDEDDSDNENE
jgi:HPr kinase/phosphorylase